MYSFYRALYTLYSPLEPSTFYSYSSTQHRALYGLQLLYNSFIALYRFSRALYSSSRALYSSFRTLYSYSITHLEPSTVYSSSIEPAAALLER